MAKVVVDVELKYKEAQAEIEGLNKQINDLKKDVVKSNQETAKSLKGVEKSADATAKGVTGIGNALKAAGIGLAIAAFAKLVEVFNENQKVTDIFSTTFETLSLAFNDFFNFLNKNIGTATGFMDSIFGNEIVQNIISFGKTLSIEVITRIKNLIEGIGGLGSALVKVFKGDFAGAAETAKEAVGNLGDAIKGNAVETAQMDEAITKVTSKISNYVKSTIDAAESVTELNKASELAAVINQGLIEKYDRQAEQQRQIRDDETKSMADRIKANVELGRILDEQSEKMLENVDIQIAAAQAQFSKNGNLENQIALQEALNEKAAVEAQIEGFRSEQLINVNSLQREQEDLKKEAEEEELERKEKLIELEKEAEEKEIERKEKLLELEEQKKQKMLENLDTIRNVSGQESAIGKALFAAKTAMLVKEQIAEAKATLSKITMKTAEASVATATGVAETAKVGFPQNIPLIIAFAAQAAGIFSAINSAVGAAKSSIPSVGGAGGGAVSAAPAPSIPPAFNVVGAAPENQLAQAIGGQQERPIQAFVVGSEVTTQQALDRNIVDNASLG